MASLLSSKKSIPVEIKSMQRNPFLALQTELDRAMNDFYSTFEAPRAHFSQFENLMISPAIDLVEDEKNFKVEIEMPGVSEKEIKVSIRDGALTVKAEKTTSKKDKEKDYLCREISYGSYERTIALPDNLDTEHAKASFKKGMLWVTIPKKVETAKHDLPIENAN